MTDLPHFAFPFTFNAAGVAGVNEQDSPEDVGACVAYLLSCPIGDRVDEEDFGRPELMFAKAPLDLNAVQDAINRWEPRVADLSLSEFGDVTNEAWRRVTVAVGVEEG